MAAARLLLAVAARRAPARIGLALAREIAAPRRLAATPLASAIRAPRRELRAAARPSIPLRLASPFVLDIAGAREELDRALDAFVSARHKDKPLYPEYMLGDLRKRSAAKFEAALRLAQERAIDLKVKETSHLLQRIVFETALALARTEEDRISIMSPDLPKVGERIVHEELPQAGVVTSREFVPDATGRRGAFRLHFEVQGKEGSKLQLSCDYAIKRGQESALLSGLLKDVVI